MAKNEITVWGRLSSSNVQVVLWCLDELGLDFKRIDAGFTYGVVDTPQYLGMNPNGTIPTLIDGVSPPIFESGAILRYLAASYATDSFWPSDPVARAQIDKWAEWAKINIANLFTAPVFWQVVRTAPSRQDPEMIARNIAALTKYLKIAEARLAQDDYLAGDQFTLADIQMGHCLYRYFDIDIARADLPHLRRYYDRLCQRPAYAKYVMADYSELRVTD
jgi:glutathione S-transferase